MFGSKRQLDDAELHGAPNHFPRPSRLAAPLEVEGKKAAAAAQSLGLSSVSELLEHLPRDRREARSVAELRRARPPQS